MEDRLNQSANYEKFCRSFDALQGKPIVCLIICDVKNGANRRLMNRLKQIRKLWTDGIWVLVLTGFKRKKGGYGLTLQHAGNQVQQLIDQWEKETDKVFGSSPWFEFWTEWDESDPNSGTLEKFEDLIDELGSKANVHPGTKVVGKYIDAFNYVKNFVAFVFDAPDTMEDAYENLRKQIREVYHRVDTSKEEFAASVSKVQKRCVELGGEAKALVSKTQKGAQDLSELGRSGWKWGLGRWVREMAFDYVSKKISEVGDWFIPSCQPLPEGEQEAMEIVPGGLKERVRKAITAICYMELIGNKQDAIISSINYLLEDSESWNITNPTEAEKHLGVMTQRLEYISRKVTIQETDIP